MLLLRASIGVFIVLAAVAAAPAQADSGAEPVPIYTIIDLGTLGVSASIATAISDIGQMVGSADRDSERREVVLIMKDPSGLVRNQGIYHA